MRFLFLLPLCFCFLISSCGESKFEGLKEELIHHNLLANKPEKVVFIPYQGCSTCVSKALSYLKTDGASENLQFVFINYRSEKEIKIRLQAFGIKSDGCLFVKNAQNLYTSGIPLFYPSIVTVNQTELNVIVADPNNLDVWDDL